MENWSKFTTKRLNQKLKLPREKTQAQGFTGEFYQTVKELIPVLHQVFQKKKEERKPLNHFESSIILMKKKNRGHYPL